MRILVLLIMFIPVIANAQLSKNDSIWLPMSFFLGEWIGEGGGEPGTGKYNRSYGWVLNKKFIEIKNKSSYQASTQNPKGEIHEDIGFISYDKIRKTFILRQFHVEGFVNKLRHDSTSADKKVLVFISESIENIPKGWRAKETYQILNDHEMEETFELAEPEKEFVIYTTVRLKRK